MSETEFKINKNILIAVDESENARRAVSYVGQLLGGLPGFKVAVLHVIPDPEEDYFPEQKEKDNWLARMKQKVDTMLADYRQILIDAGFSEDNVSGSIRCRSLFNRKHRPSKNGSVWRRGQTARRHIQWRHAPAGPFDGQQV